jgi:prepilin-type N-terminal cleavage/methylation domain-containing protein
MLSEVLQNSRKRANSCGAGFTLVEMLVVIAIIVLLMAILMPVYGKVRIEAKKKATDGLIRGLGAGLELYKNEFESFPPTPNGGADTSDDGTLFKYLAGPEGHGIVANAGTPREKRFASFLQIPAEFIKSKDGKNVIVDAFGMPIHYFNCKAFVDSGKDPTFCHNPDSYDIYSTGVDKMKDPDLVEPGTKKVEDKGKVHYVDDQMNW